MPKVRRTIYVAWIHKKCKKHKNIKFKVKALQNIGATLLFETPRQSELEHTILTTFAMWFKTKVVKIVGNYIASMPSTIKKGESCRTIGLNPSTTPNSRKHGEKLQVCDSETT